MNYVCVARCLNLLRDCTNQFSKVEKDTRRLTMNHSIYSADRSTHLKVVVVALVAGIAVAGLGISARLGGADDGYTQTARVIKAGKPMMVTTSGTTAIR
jgi:hypothetical protein